MARYKVITSKMCKHSIDKKRRHICLIVDIIYIFLLMTSILIIGINQFNPLFVGYGLIIIGGISIPTTIFHIYITKNKWSISPVYTNDVPEIKIGIAIVIIFLASFSVICPILGILRLLGIF